MSYVVLDHCKYCGEAKSILLDQRLRDTAFKDGAKYAISDEPCDKCKEGMAKGFAIIEVGDDGATGNLWVIKLEAAKANFDADFLASCKENKCLVTPETAKEMGLYNVPETAKVK